MRAPRLSCALLCALLLAAAGAYGGGELPPAWHSSVVKSARLAEPGERVVRLSARFLATPYRANTLIGRADIPEQLVVAMDGVDCFTLLDYVEAMRRSATPGDFRRHLVEVRYRGGVIAWEKRRHFFTDWAADPGSRVVDVTAEVGGPRTREAVKTLNRDKDGSPLLPGVPVSERTVRYLPSEALDAALLKRLRPGDYLGIYSPKPWIDVSHVGIAVQRAGRWFLRHASSRREAGKVIDSDLLDYLAGRPGLVVLRPQ